MPQPRRLHGLVARLAAPLLTLLFCSCGSNAVRVHPVRGQLLRGGTARRRRRGGFPPFESVRPCRAAPVGLRRAGWFLRPHHLRAEDGAPAGAYAVAVAWFADVSQANPVTGALAR